MGRREGNGEIPIKAKVQCEDGPGGEATHVIVHPATSKVTKIVVKEVGSPHVKWIVPLKFVQETAANQIRLRCSRQELSKMLPFVRTEFVETSWSYDGRAPTVIKKVKRLNTAEEELATVVGGSEQPELWLDKTTFAPGEEFQVHFATPATFPSDAWAGIIPSEVPHGSGTTNDEYDLDHGYLKGRLWGALTFLAPNEPGSYDVRLHDTDDNGREVASVTFQVNGD